MVLITDVIGSRCRKNCRVLGRHGGGQPRSNLRTCDCTWKASGILSRSGGTGTKVEIRLATLMEELWALESKEHSSGLSAAERDRRAEMQAEIGQGSLASGIVGFYEKLHKEPEQWRPRVDGLGLPAFNSEEVDLLKYLCLPKKGAGLGIRDLVLFNKALLGNWIWRFALGEDKLWCRVIKGKYGILRGAWRTKDIIRSHETGLWKGIMKVGGDFSPQVSYQLGNGSNISFWYDDWCSQMPLRDRFPELFALATYQDASNVLKKALGGVWAPLFRRKAQDWELEAFEEFFRMLQEVHPISQENDKWRWKRQGKGSFTMSSFYQSLTGIGDPTFLWKGIWVSKVPSKVYFGWAATKGAILTIDNLRRRG
ncbi:hypothetical protein Acr_00g0094990 [Actinidia rufa]|uniref:Reverse transcriptase zinc-binding domain-containing protein n=1 Tax=Actinidia rufa TaxID=165716 RepID=A0A7J0DYA1_9ERIC|nr:hypothetical protein Acr_00g0094990 [Actinidia rufa]